MFIFHVCLCVCVCVCVFVCVRACKRKSRKQTLSVRESGGERLIDCVRVCAANMQSQLSFTCKHARTHDFHVSQYAYRQVSCACGTGCVSASQCIFQCLHISQPPSTPGYPLSPEHTYPRLPSSDPAGLPGTFPLLPIVSHSTAIEWEEEYDRGRAIKKGLGSDRVERWGESAPDKVGIESGLATLICNSLLTCRPSARPYKIELPILSIHVILDG